MFLAAAALSGCGAEIDHAEVETRNGLIYKYGDTDPFSGRVLNQPVGVPGITLGQCDSQVEKGRFSGKTQCLSGEQVVYEVEFLAGKKHGVEIVTDVKTGEKKSLKTWRNGLQDGVEEGYLNGVLVLKREYKSGKLHGQDTRWSSDGKTVLTDITWREGNKDTGFTTDSEGKLNYLNGKMHGAQVKYSYVPGENRQFTSAEENYENGKLEGVQKYFIYIYSKKAVQQESEVAYAGGAAVSGWFKRFDKSDGSLIQEFRLTQSPKREEDGFYSNYPGRLVPDGLIQSYDHQAGRFNGEELWVNGVKVKYYYDPYGNGEFEYNVLNISSGYESYIVVSVDEYNSFMASSGLDSAVVPSRVEADKSSSPVSREQCLDEWISVYRKEMGDDAMIVSEQISEWSEWCGEGKLP